MRSHKSCWLPLASCLLAFLAQVFPAAAQAEEASAAPPAGPPPISPAQLTAFAELIGEPRPVVWQHLLADPGLVPLAAAAADTRMERKSTGKTMTIVGFTILGVGVGVGYYLMWSGIMSGTDCLSYGSTCAPDDGKIRLGLLLAAVSLGVGCGIGIPGIVKMAKQTEVETQASERYQYAGYGRPPVYPGSYSQALPMRPPGARLDLPLWSFRF